MGGEAAEDELLSGDEFVGSWHVETGVLPGEAASRAAVLSAFLTKLYYFVELAGLDEGCCAFGEVDLRTLDSAVGHAATALAAPLEVFAT